jgi:hypothetical protein
MNYDQLGRYALRKPGAGHNAVHGAVTLCLAELSRRAGRIASVEVVGLFPAYPGQAANASDKGEKRRMDLVEQNAADGSLSLVDNTVCDNAAPTWLGSGLALEKPLRALTRAEEVKAQKYADKPAGSTLTVWAQGTQAETGKQGLEWLQKWAVDVARLETGEQVPAAKYVKKVMWGALQELGVVLMKAQAKCIFDHATLATRRRFISSRVSPAAAPTGAGSRMGRARGGR